MEGPLAHPQGMWSWVDGVLQADQVTTVAALSTMCPCLFLGGEGGELEGLVRQYCGGPDHLGNGVEWRGSRGGPGGGRALDLCPRCPWGVAVSIIGYI